MTPWIPARSSSPCTEVYVVADAFLSKASHSREETLEEWLHGGKATADDTELALKNHPHNGIANRIRKVEVLALTFQVVEPNTSHYAHTAWVSREDCTQVGTTYSAPMVSITLMPSF